MTASAADGCNAARQDWEGLHLTSPLHEEEKRRSGGGSRPPQKPPPSPPSFPLKSWFGGGGEVGKEAFANLTVHLKKLKILKV